MTYKTLVAAMAACALLAGCNGAADSDAAQPSAVASAPADPAKPVEAAEAIPQPAPEQEAHQACMIAGEFAIAGQTIRSRDCMQAPASADSAKFRQQCEGLAQTSAQMGGKAGQVAYMDACPSPNQGRCENFMRSGYDAFYYERATEDLPSVAKSCEAVGGAWTAG